MRDARPQKGSWKKILLEGRSKDYDVAPSKVQFPADEYKIANNDTSPRERRVHFVENCVDGDVSLPAAGWIIDDGESKGAHIARWVIKKETQSLFYNSIGFLKSPRRLFCIWKCGWIVFEEEL